MKKSRIEKLRAIVAAHQAAKVDGVLVDGYTASMLVQVHDALSEANRAKFVELPIKRMAEIGWAVCNSSK